MANDNVKRMVALDGLRGIAALGVAIHHFPKIFLGSGTPLIENAYLFVDMFFVLSGLVLANTYEDRLSRGQLGLKDYVSRRFFRLYPLHIATMVLFLVMLGLTDAMRFAAAQFIPSINTHSQLLDELVVKHIAVDLLMLQASGILPEPVRHLNFPSWSISSEWIVNVYFGAIWVFAKPSRVTLMITAVLSIAAIFLFNGDQYINAHVENGLGVIRCIAGFALGVLLCRLYRKRVFSTVADKLQWPVLALTLLFVWFGGWNSLSLLAPFVFAVLVLVLSYDQGPVCRLLQSAPVHWLGIRSFGIYLVHGCLINLFGNSLQIALEKARLGPMLSAIAGLCGLALFVASVLALAHFAYKYVEVPGMQLGERLRRRQGALPPAPRQTPT